MTNALIVRQAERFIKGFLEAKLPSNMTFHNFAHACYVTKAVTDIGAYSRVNAADMAVLQVAAWFHDIGYCYAYSGHEESSVAIAATFLAQQNCENEFVDAVTQCIAATKMPQQPQTLLQQIICDADMYHLSDDNYSEFASRLKAELELKANKTYSEQQWKETNLNMLVQHRYFTKYGKEVLQKHKLKNIDALLNS